MSIIVKLLFLQCAMETKADFKVDWQIKGSAWESLGSAHLLSSFWKQIDLELNEPYLQKI